MPPISLEPKLVTCPWKGRVFLLQFNHGLLQDGIPGPRVLELMRQLRRRNGPGAEWVTVCTARVDGRICASAFDLGGGVIRHAPSGLRLGFRACLLHFGLCDNPPRDWEVESVPHEAFDSWREILDVMEA